jgi:putative addiction module component (TIGR02574 family)
VCVGPRLGSKVLGIMASFSPNDFRSLSVLERLALIEAIWESLEDQQDEAPLSDEHRALLDERIADMEANPGDGLTWEQLKAKLSRTA